MKEKRCTKCGKVKPIDQFNWKKMGVLRRSECKACWSIYIKEHYRKNRQYYLDKATRRMNGIRKPLREYVQNYLMEHPCVDCGEARTPCLVFDHVRGEKSYNISNMIARVKKGTTIDDVQAEIDKCEVRCANCHRIRHARERGIYVPE